MMEAQMDAANLTDNCHGEVSYSPKNKYVADISPEDLINVCHENGANNFFIFWNPVNREKSIPRTKPFVLKSELENFIQSRDIEVRHTNKSLLIRTGDTENAIACMSRKTILGTDINPNLIKENITTKFVIRGVPTNECVEKLAQDIEAENNLTVLEARRFIKASIPTYTVLLTICGRVLPDKIKFCYQMFEANFFVDNPKFCENCLRIGHLTRFCRRNQRCPKCGAEILVDAATNTLSHEIATCKTIKCGNCEENHYSNDRQCTNYLMEKKLIESSITNNLPLFEMKRIFFNEEKNYAKKTAQPPVQAPVSRLKNQNFEKKMEALFENKIQTLVNHVNSSLDQFRTSMIQTVGDAVTKQIEDFKLATKCQSNLNENESLSTHFVESKITSAFVENIRCFEDLLSRQKQEILFILEEKMSNLFAQNELLLPPIKRGKFSGSGNVVEVVPENMDSDSSTGTVKSSDFVQ